MAPGEVEKFIGASRQRHQKYLEIAFVTGVGVYGSIIGYPALVAALHIVLVFGRYLIGWLFVANPAEARGDSAGYILLEMGSVSPSPRAFARREATPCPPRRLAMMTLWSWWAPF